MGLKEWYRAQDARHKAHVDGLRQGVVGRYGLVAYVEGENITAQGVTRPVAGVIAEYESGADRKRPTLTRVAAGAVIAGPAGAIVGGLFRKDTTRGYITVTFPDGGVIVIDGPVRDEKEMREFAQVVNNASRHHAA